jgi:hypothetical protein
MKPPSFDKFIAIDWSGARNHYNGIAVAACTGGTAAPTLIDCGRRTWTRNDVALWLGEQLRGRSRLLVGLDFAFGFPFEDRLGYLGGTAGVDDIFDLWALIDRRSGTDPDFGCAEFLRHRDHLGLFWSRLTKPPRWLERKRETELVCAAMTETRPDTVYKLIGPKQVGKASITGIRVLQHVRARSNGRLAIWPFESISASGFVEIYPTLFRRLATGRLDKIRTWKTLNEALRRFGSSAMTAVPRATPTDHETDALLSAAGLRALASEPAAWALDRGKMDRVRREGWIFGSSVGAVQSNASGCDNKDRARSRG